MNLQAWIEAKLQALVGFYFVDESSPNRDSFVETHPAQAPAQKGRLRARRMWPFGIRSLPPRGVEAITVGPMASQQKVIIAAESNAYGPTDLAEGDTALYSSAHKEDVVAILLIYADGNIRVQTSKANCHVVVKPGSSGKVKLGDDVDGNLDSVALYTALKSYIDNHVHGPGSYTTPMGGGAVTGSSGTPGALPSSVASANVVAKKP